MADDIMSPGSWIPGYGYLLPSRREHFEWGLLFAQRCVAPPRSSDEIMTQMRSGNLTVPPV